MESIRGRRSVVIDAAVLMECLQGYPQRLFDIGTGDGRFVQHVARHYRGYFALGIDTCRENLRVASSKSLCNTLYVIANACALPNELHGLATHMTINFPWGSLLYGLLKGDNKVYAGLAALGQPGTRLEIRLNGGALAENGWSLEAGIVEVGCMLRDYGFDVDAPVAINTCELRKLPTTWAKRLAFGRDPRAVLLNGRRNPAD